MNSSSDIYTTNSSDISTNISTNISTDIITNISRNITNLIIITSISNISSKNFNYFLTPILNYLRTWL